jgi:phosphoglycerate dehydrogenase-like enzyme
MMPNIAAFKNFLQNDLGMDVIVAKVEERLSEEDLAKYNGLYDIALIGDDAFTFDLIGSTGVKCICKWGTGIDSISKPGCQKYNISLRNTVDAFSEPVAETMMAALLSFIRGTHRSTLMMGYSDAWTKIQGRTLDEVSVGIIGLGNVGCNFANKLSHYKTKIYGYDILVDACFRATREADVIILSGIDELLNKADIVCLCCDYNDDNYHLINYNRLSLMKHGSYLINMARGKLIDLDALTDSLLVGKLAGVALDVFEIEPLPMESALRKMPNVILSSHNANSSPKYWMNVHKNTIRNALKYLRGE